MSKTNVSVSVDYSDGTPPTITFTSGGSAWETNIMYGDSVTFTLTPTPGCDGFDFQNLVVGFTNEAPIQQVAQSFSQQLQATQAQTYYGISITGIMITNGTLTFTVANQNSAGSELILGVEIAVKDTTTNYLYVSQDPQITLGPNSG